MDDSLMPNQRGSIMQKSDELLRFEADINADGKLRESFDAAIKRIAGAGETTNDGDAMVKAAAELGYDLSLNELERLYAESQELSDEELGAVAGGRADSCMTDYYCYTVVNHDSETDPDGKKESVACFVDYKCMAYWN